MKKLHATKVRAEFEPPESVKLANSSGSQKNIDYSEAFYESRPSGWDYISTTLTETVADNEAQRRDKENYKTAAQAVENFEDYQITSIDKAQGLDNEYYYVMSLVNAVCMSMLMMPHLLINWRSIVLYAMSSKEVNQKELYFHMSFSGISPAFSFSSASSPPFL